jgi:putative transcriptional regulator
MPAALRRYVGCDLSQLTWRAVLNGVEQAVIAEGRFGEACFLRCRAGKRFRWHGHTGLEAILVLKGAFSNEQGHYETGDIAVADESCIHRPVVDDAGEFICFRVAEDRLKVHGPIGRMLEQIFGR